MVSLTVRMIEQMNKIVVCKKIHENLLKFYKLKDHKKYHIACGPNQWQCDYGNCISLSKRCNGNIDCPEDMSDERNCPSKFKFYSNIFLNE